MISSSPDNSDSLDQPEATPVNPAEIFVIRATSPEELNILSLVLSAAQITHRVKYTPSRQFEIHVSSLQKEKAEYEIAAYKQENRNWPPQSESTDIPLLFRAMSPLIVGCLMLFYSVTGGWQIQSHWFEAGAGNSGAILSGSEFYRLITALTLHADLVHLLGNCFIGVFLLHFFFQLTGNGIGLLTMLVTAALANYLNVMVHGAGHNFVGFSTAIFSVIGMLCTMGFATRTMHYFQHFFMPVMAGLALLALLGSSGERTDLGAHLFGLLCGLAMGSMVYFPAYDKLRRSVLCQFLLATACLTVPFIAWFSALSR